MRIDAAYFTLGSAKNYLGTTAQTIHAVLHDRQRKTCGHRGISGITTPLQHLLTRLASQWVGATHASRANRNLIGDGTWEVAKPRSQIGIRLLGGIAAASSSDGSSRAAGNVAVIGGGYLLKSGLEKRAEVQIHVEALEELGLSLESEITPQVIELDDRTIMLSGNVEDQYAQWREILAEIYATEVGALELPEESHATTDTL